MGAVSAAETETAAQLRAYGAWPQSVKPLIDQITPQFVTLADNDHQLSAAKTVDQWMALKPQGDAADKECTRLSAL